MEAVKPRLVIVETLGALGRVQARDRIVLTPEKTRVTIGRSAEADVILDDPYAAALHACIEAAPDGTILVSDLGSANGIGIGGRRQKSVQQVPLSGGLLQVGRTRLRVRAAGEALPPEKLDHAPIAPEQAPPWWAAAAAATVCAAYVAYSAWMEAPRDLATAIAVAFIPALVGAGAWLSFWSLLSRIMLSQWRWLWHGAILFTVLAAYLLGSGALDLAWFVYTLPRWESRGTIVATIAFAAALYWHLTCASGASRRSTAIIAIALPATVTCAGLWIQSRVQERDVNHIGVAERIYPPAVRFRESRELEEFFERASLLQASADAKRRRIAVDDVSDSAFDDGMHSRDAREE